MKGGRLPCTGGFSVKKVRSAFLGFGFFRGGGGAMPSPFQASASAASAR